MAAHDPPAIERAEADYQAGDYGMARQRLASLLASRGYSNDLLIRLGEISWAMHDHEEAGRYWIASTAQGDDVDRAIAAFIACHGPDPRQLVAQLPAAARLKDAYGYPEAARRRLEMLGLLDDILTCAKARAARSTQQTHWLDSKCVAAVLIVVFIIGVGCFVAGFLDLVRWLFNVIW